MVNEEILGGLKSAIERDEKLTDAMNSFLNAGYKKPEIEEAARILKQEQGEQPQNAPENPEQQGPENTKKKTARKKSPTKKTSKKTSKKKPKKRVSNYESKKKSKGTPKWLIISIVIAALILVGTMIAYFLST
ncbi:MAG: hypothetical protein ABEI74_00635 [Candidatus Pacearchaeota archaeon]